MNVGDLIDSDLIGSIHHPLHSNINGKFFQTHGAEVEVEKSEAKVTK